MTRAVDLAMVASFMLSSVSFAESGHGNDHDTGSISSGAHWSYDGNTAPAQWDSLGYSLCGNGKNQSPVDISRSVAVNLDEIEFHYTSSPTNLIDNGHTIQFNYAPGSNVKVGGVQYDLIQFHFHAPSENTIDGKSFPMEMHLVHKSKDGRLAVVGVLFEETDEDIRIAQTSTLEQVFDSIAAHTSKKIIGNSSISAFDLLPEAKDYYHFMGSLTTPPCTEGVAWFVMSNPIKVSKNKIAAFESLYDHNARLAQPWNNRVIYTSTVSAGGR